MTDETPGADEPGTDSLTTRGELIAAAALVIGAVVLIGGVLLFVGPTGTDDPGPSPTPAASESVSPSVTQAAFPIVPQNADEEAINELARRSIVTIPEGTWPELYPDFTTEFHARCPLEEFTQVGINAANDLGDSLPLLGFVGLRELAITGDTARAVIVGELRGQSEYEVEAHFRREGGAWKIAPVPGSEGCASFNRLGG